jgi:hypothetical protein
MEYVKDFLKKRKSKYVFALGILFLIVVFSSIPKNSTKRIHSQPLTGFILLYLF